MTTYARIVDGCAVDVVTTPPSLADRFNADWLKNQTFYVAPADTLVGRPGIVNPDGSVTWGSNPSPAQPAMTDLLLSASGFQDTCETALGGNSTGATRFGKIIRDMSASNNDLVFSLYQRFMKSETFDKPKVSKFLSALVTATIITAQERTSILAAWPTVAT